MYRYLHLFILLGLTLVCQQVKSQFSIELVDSSQGQTSFRGLSVVTDKVVWVSGSKGTVGLSKDGGKSWKWMHIPGFEKSDFRDIEAFDKNTAIIMASGTPAVILKTVDGGDNWKVVFRDNRPEMFLDAMDFWDKKRGMLVGDPINGRFVLLETTNGGDSWRMLDSTLCPEAHDSEAVFAASGTSLRCWGKSGFGFVTGGARSVFYHKDAQNKNWEEYRLGFSRMGIPSQGAFSLARSNKHWLFAGGDYQQDTTFRPYSFEYNLLDPVELVENYHEVSHGYKSSIEVIATDMVIVTGTSSTEIGYFRQINGNAQEFRFSKIGNGFHVVRKAKKGKAVFLAGSKGRIGKLR
ncbi:MAG: YCF48-related protein [Bacteroidia bacterium]